MPRALPLTLLAAAVLATTGADALIPAVPIPDQPGQSAPYEHRRTDATPGPVRSHPVPQHPFMAANGTSNIHNDAYMTDAYTVAGPTGDAPMEVTSTWLGLEECASITFDSRDRIVGLCGTVDGARLRMLDPTTLETLAVLPLPPRQVRPGTTPLNDFCAAGYFYLNHQDRGVLSTNTNQIWVVLLDELPRIGIERIIDLNRWVLPPDCLVSVLPDWEGRLWFVSKGGVVGTVDPITDAVQTMKLQHRNGDEVVDEGVFNSFSVDESGGVYIVTDYALYRFDAERPSGAPRVTWRTAYDRGTELKPGMLSQGSGTSPTLFGRRWLANADNADPMNVEVYDRRTGDRICSAPVFDEGASATENSLIVAGNAIIVENNYGYLNPTTTSGGGTTAPGIARVDFDPRTGTCSNAWTSDVVAPTSVPKASLATGLVYVYGKPAQADGNDPWYFTAIDIATGELVFEQLTGLGYLYNNHYAPISIGPDGAAYAGALGGLIRIADPPAS